MYSSEKKLTYTCNDRAYCGNLEFSVTAIALNFLCWNERNTCLCPKKHSCMLVLVDDYLHILQENLKSSARRSLGCS